MPDTGLTAVDRTIHETNEWLNEIGSELGTDRQGSYRALRGVLHALRDRLTVDESAHLAVQLPTLIRGIYYEGYQPSKQPMAERSLDEFLDTIRQDAGPGPEMDPAEAGKVVLKVLDQHADAGEMGHVFHLLPADFKPLLPH